MKVSVLGAGAIGLAVAWRCARQGLDVTVHDPDPQKAAAWVAAGMLGPVTEVHYGEEALLALNLDSARRWPDFAKELSVDGGTDPGYLQCERSPPTAHHPSAAVPVHVAETPMTSSSSVT